LTLNFKAEGDSPLVTIGPGQHALLTVAGIPSNFMAGHPTSTVAIDCTADPSDPVELGDGTAVVQGKGTINLDTVGRRRVIIMPTGEPVRIEGGHSAMDGGTINVPLVCTHVDGRWDITDANNDDDFKLAIELYTLDEQGALDE
jgi:hypothetical protein